MSKGAEFRNSYLKFIFNAQPIANIADDAASGALTSLQVSLHTADPGEAGNQATSEVNYGGYARTATARTTDGWAVDGNSASPATAIVFPIATSTSTMSATHVGIGTSTSGDGKILYRGEISPPIHIAEGVTPFLDTDSFLMEGTEASAPDETAPSPIAFSPLDDAIDAPTDGSSATIQFDEDIQFGEAVSISFYIFDGEEYALIQELTETNIGNGLSISGDTLTIDLPFLNAGDGYSIQVASGSIEDLAGNPWTGIADHTTWNFTGEEAAGDALADFLTAQSAIIWLDHADAATMFQERTGTPPSTLSDVDDVVGSIFNKGSLGGYARASADGARGVRRAGDYIQVDGSDDRYNFAASFSTNDGLNYTLALAGRVTNNGEGTLFGDGANNSVARYESGSGDSASNFGGANHEVDGSATTTEDAVHDAMRDVDAVMICDWNSIFASGTLIIGNHTFNIPMAGRIYQAVVIPGVLDSTDRATLTSLLQGRIP